MGAHPLFSTLSRRRLNPIKLAYSPSPPDNGLGQYVSSPGHGAYCYAELAVSSLAMAVIIASTHFAYPRRDGQAELAWVAYKDGLPVLKTVTHPSTNRARRGLTSLMRPTT